jgi:hypothetical protein
MFFAMGGEKVTEMHVRNETARGTMTRRMSSRIAIAICLIVLSTMIIGCSHDGPFYAVEQLIVDDSGVHAVLSRSRTRTNWLLYGDTEPRRNEYVVAQVELSDPAKLTDCRPIGKTGWNETKRFHRVSDSALLVELRGDYERIQIDFEDFDRRARPVLRIARDPDKTARALSRSNRHLLIVDDQSERLIELPRGDVIESRSDSDLMTLRRELVARFGSAGTWWLSDDLKFVTIKPPEWVTEPGMARTPEKMPAKLFGINLRLDADGLIYDRARDRFEKFALEVVPAKPRDYRVEVADAESIQGELMLLYGARGVREKEILVVTPNLGRGYRSDVEFNSESFPADVAWRPTESRVYFLEYAGHGGISSPPFKREPAFRIHVLDYTTKKTWHYAMENEELISAVDRTLR